MRDEAVVVQSDIEKEKDIYRAWREVELSAQYRDFADLEAAVADLKKLLGQ